MPNNKERDKRIKRIEHHLRNYKTYKVGLYNLKKQLDYIMPSMTATYELANGSSGTFNIKSDTEKYAIDRIESKKALMIHENISQYELIIGSIEKALENLEDIEKEFVDERYFKGKPINHIVNKLGFSEKYVFTIRNQVMDKLLISLKGLIQF